MSLKPPPFQEATQCDVCNCSFNTFRRRHHCRCCGRTLCAEHSSNQMTLPQFGLHSSARVCTDCFNNATSHLTESVSRLDISTTSIKTEHISERYPALPVPECKCGMPLCICEAPAPPTNITTSQGKDTSSFTINSNQKPRKASVTQKSKGSTSNSKQFLEKPDVEYEVSGEGFREAIKNGDTAAARKLLAQGVNANYCDKQGSSLLHLAAVFNQTEIAFALIESGASLDCTNSQGETPLDCAPATLQYKMKKKMEESEQSGA